MTDTTFWMALAMMFASALYSSVGHGGASAYLATMALFGVPTTTMKPTALILNLMVSSIGLIRYVRAGQFDLRLFLGFALPAIPMAFLGGMIHLPPEIYRPLVGLVLLAAAFQLMRRAKPIAARAPTRPSLLVSVPIGAGLGLLAGLTGTGGGIFLSPILILSGWSAPRVTSGIAAAFIFANSAAGLAGNFASLGRLPPELPWLAGAVIVGAFAGTWFGALRLPQSALVRLLSLVLLIAGAKLLLG